MTGHGGLFNILSVGKTLLFLFFLLMKSIKLATCSVMVFCQELLQRLSVISTSERGMPGSIARVFNLFQNLKINYLTGVIIFWPSTPMATTSALIGTSPVFVAV